MKGSYKNECAKCNVLTSEVFPVGVFELSALETIAGSRRQGYATELLTEVCNDADIEGAVLVLSPADEAVHKFYERFGFKAIQPRPVLMARAPEIFKVKMNPISTAVTSAIHGR